MIAAYFSVKPLIISLTNTALWFIIYKIVMLR